MSHWRKHGHWITRDLERQEYAWGIVCGDQVVEGSGDIFEFPDEEMLVEIGKDLNLIPFAYSRDIRPEETVEETVTEPGCTGARRWSRTRYIGDWYPRLAVRIEGICIEDDFDTGALQTLVAPELVGKGAFDFFRTAKGKHLGEEYSFFTKKVEIEIEDCSGERERAVIPVSVVKDWEGSVFQSINPERRALIGRDILRAFDIQISLDSSVRGTKVRFCGGDRRT